MSFCVCVLREIFFKTIQKDSTNQFGELLQGFVI